MRLTLRTLLAYLDDILEPSQTKEIGSKLSESQFASDLVDRIREVMRRRRLSAPDVMGNDGALDANLVAEYLDNTLSAESVSDVERLCLESDVNLAEAASCHQILTLVLGEPVEISVESRRRMYGLVSQGSGDEQAAVAASSQNGAAAKHPDGIAELPSASDGQKQTESRDTDLPDYLKPRPFLRRVLVIAIPLVLIFVFLILNDSGWNGLGKWFGGGAPVPIPNAPVTDRPETVKARPPIPAATAATPAIGAPAVESNPPDMKGAPAGTAIAGDAKMRGGAKVAQNLELPAEPAVSATQSRPAEGPAIPTAGHEPLSAAAGPTHVAVVTPAPARSPIRPEPVPETAVNPSKVDSPLPAEPAPEVRLVSNKGVLLGYDTARDDWFVVERPGLTLPKPAPANSETPGGVAGDLGIKGEKAAKIRVPSPPPPLSTQRRADDLAAPEPFDSTLEFGDGLCRVWLLGGTSVHLLAPSGGARFGIKLREGRIVIRSGAPKDAGAAYRPLVIAVAVQDEHWQIELLQPETQCGLEIVPDFPTKPGEDVKEIGYRGALYVLSGEVRFTEAEGRQRTLTAERWISLAPADRAVATALQGLPLRVKGAAMPPWLSPQTHRSISTSLAKVADDFAAEFLSDQPVSLSIGPVAKNNRPKVSELAVKTLALTNQYQELVGVLAQVPHEEAVQAAANGLRAWLPRAGDHSELLEEELKTLFVPADQKIVLRLLWGYNKDDARDRATSNQLVEWLDHDKLAVRTLAINQIHERTGQTKNYHPAMPSNERKRIKKEWESYVERNKGLLKH